MLFKTVIYNELHITTLIFGKEHCVCMNSIYLAFRNVNTTQSCNIFIFFLKFLYIPYDGRSGLKHVHVTCYVINR